jgi:hypothetical protein
MRVWLLYLTAHQPSANQILAREELEDGHQQLFVGKDRASVLRGADCFSLGLDYLDRASTTGDKHRSWRLSRVALVKPGGSVERVALAMPPQVHVADRLCRAVARTCRYVSIKQQTHSVALIAPS